MAGTAAIVGLDATATEVARRDSFENEAMPNFQDLYRAALRMVRNSDKAADAVQETYLLAWKSFDKYQRGTNCRAWLFQILFNVVRHERRGWFKWMTGKIEDIGQVDQVAPESVPQELSDRMILEALDGLPARFREVVLLVDAEEFSYKEASEILSIPIGTIMSRLSRGRTMLRAELEPVATAYGLRPVSSSTTFARASRA